MCQVAPFCTTHGLMQKATCVNDVAIVNVRRNDHRINFWYMSKDEAMNLLRNDDLTEKSATIKYIMIYKNGSGNYNVW